MTDLEECKKALLDSFPGSFINPNNEFIAHLYSNQYIILGNCETPQDIECKEKLDEAVKRAYELRHDFIFSISETEAKSNAHLIIEFDIRKDWEGAGNGGYYMRYVHELFANRSVQGANGYDLIANDVHNHPFCSLLRHAYTRWADNDDLGYVDYYANHAKSERLDIIYEFLVSMGYVMSDEEIAMKDGTSQLYAALSETSNESDDDYDEEQDEEDTEYEEDEADE